MRGRGRNQAPLPLEKPVPVKLNGEEREAKGHRLAVIGLAIRAYKRKLRIDGRDTKKAITNLEKERDDIEDALIADQELRMQGDLTFEEKQRAQEVLASVERVAQGGDAPTPPHTFVPSGAGEGKCYSCKHAKEHEVHKGTITPAAAGKAASPSSTSTAVGKGEAAKPSEHHVFVSTGGTGNAAQMCKTCGSGLTDPIHGPELPPAQEPAARPPKRPTPIRPEKGAH